MLVHQLFFLSLLSPTAAAGSAACNQPNMARFIKQQGKWEGQVLVFTTKGRVKDQYKSKTTIRLITNAQDVCELHQQTTYSWIGGRKRIVKFSGKFDKNGKLVYDKNDFRIGTAWHNDYSTVAYYFIPGKTTVKALANTHQPEPDVRITSTQHLVNDKLISLMLVNENRIK